MPAITLPDGSQRKYGHPVSAMDVAWDIGTGLAKAPLACEVDGKLRDASFLIENHATICIITARDSEGLEVIRHSTAHLSAQAVQRLYPEAQLTIGPVIGPARLHDG